MQSICDFYAMRLYKYKPYRDIIRYVHFLYFVLFVVRKRDFV